MSQLSPQTIARHLELVQEFKPHLCHPELDSGSH